MFGSKKITGEVEISQSIIEYAQLKIKNIPDFQETIKSFLKKTTTELVEIILMGSINLNASDIHIEPEKERIKIRIRIDGILEDVVFFDLKEYHPLISRIKLLSGIKLNVTDRPQDGRFSILIKDNPIEIRSSSIPSEYGESIVLRILNPKNLISLEQLGLREDLLEIFKKEIKKPNGMIVVTGPTGSGKTTTLYAILEKLNKPEVKIITIEDPIEYQLEGISQTQVDPEKGYDFASGLKAIMRQDPDIVLVGEIRDSETANIALQAALTGHLVLSTLHTNDAAGAISRFRALLMEKQDSLINIAPAINIIIAQRLIRKVCKKCRILETISTKELEMIKKELKEIPKEIKIPKLTKKTKISKIKGCKYCNFTGYKGREAIFESFLIDDEMEDFISKFPPTSSLREFAKRKGMVSMRQDGFIKVLKETTTIDEVERVTVKR